MTTAVQKTILSSKDSSYKYRHQVKRELGLKLRISIIFDALKQNTLAMIRKIQKTHTLIEIIFWNYAQNVDHFYAV
jgi:N-acetylmuramoyl-L-alanine amidase